MVTSGGVLAVWMTLGGRWHAGRGGFSLVEVLTAVTLLGFGLIGLAAASGWIVGSGEWAGDEAGRIVALRAAVEEVGAMPFDSMGSGRNTDREFEVTWTPMERTPASILLRFVVIEAGAVRDEVSTVETSVADTLEHRLSRP